MNSHVWNKVLWGLMLITVGVFFLLDQIGLIEFEIWTLFSTYWPVFVIYAGLMGFVWQSKQNYGSAIWNLIVCCVGVIFLLNNLNLTNLSLSDLFKFIGPVALILFGISMIFKPKPCKKTPKESSNSYDTYSYESKEIKSSADLSQAEKEVLKEIHGEFGAEKRQAAWDLSKPKASPKPVQDQVAPNQHDHKHHDHKQHKYNHFVNHYSPEGVQHKSSFIGDVHLGQQPWELQPMVISHFIGDTIIDLTRASIPIGETPLTISTFIGDVKIFIPNDVDIEVKVIASSFIGDMNILDRKETGMFRHMDTQTSYYDESQRKLIVTTNMFIGDVIVKKIG